MIGLVWCQRIRAEEGPRNEFEQEEGQFEPVDHRWADRRRSQCGGSATMVEIMAAKPVKERGMDRIESGSASDAKYSGLCFCPKYARACCLP